MAAYHQMGNDTRNLVSERPQYSGLIASPVNDQKSDVGGQIAQFQRDEFEVVFDPQLYFPQSERGQLRTWEYFPSDVDTADLSSDVWWNSVQNGLLATLEDLKPRAACTPAVVPKEYSNDYYAAAIERSKSFCSRAVELGIRPLETILVRAAEMGSGDRAMQVASIASRTGAKGIYLVVVSDRAPRLELNDTEELKGIMRLIRTAEDSGLPVLVGFSGPEVVLWKAAGATACATGKFFNLRRFTPGRFADPQEGGGQLPYWLEESLVAYLRESDLVRVEKLGLLSESTKRNPYAQQILAQLKSDPKKAWLALGWRQYMWWFADVEARIRSGAVKVNELLWDADENWGKVQEADLFMEERRNDGGWIRPWRRAVAEFDKE